MEMERVSDKKNDCIVTFYSGSAKGKQSTIS